MQKNFKTTQTKQRFITMQTYFINGVLFSVYCFRFNENCYLEIKKLVKKIPKFFQNEKKFFQKWVCEKKNHQIRYIQSSSKSTLFGSAADT